MMRGLPKLLSAIALLLTVLAPLSYFVGFSDHSSVKLLVLVGTVLWFLSTPMWMGREPLAEETVAI